MIKVFVFIKATSPAIVAELGKSIADIEGVSECYSVTGEHDLISLLWLRNHEDIATVVTENIASRKGIASTTTVIAFRTYSSADETLV
jgi:DNA-binding Lrp family transcriptional regulator